MKKLTLEMKVGLFAFVTVALIIFMTARVSKQGLFRSGDYSVNVILDSAEGLTHKTPVEIAGIQVGYIEELELHQGNRALVKLRLSKQVKLGHDAVAQVRTKGFLGETYIELRPGNPDTGTMEEGDRIQATNPYADLGQIASDMKEITGSIKKMLSEQENGPIIRILKNMESFTGKLSELTMQNQNGINEIVSNLRLFSSDLSDVMNSRKESLKDTMDRLNHVTTKIDEGRGTIGRLINDEETAQNINEAARGLKETLGGINRFQFEIGYHLEYLAKSKDFKNYAGVVFRPRPDKYFQLDFVVDPSPSPVTTVTRTVVTTATGTSEVTTQDSVVEKDKLLISAQLAKQFYDFTLRGGMIESTGGIGLDYQKGPFGIQLSAFDFRSEDGSRPHLKATGTVNLTRNIYLTSGVDDFISKEQDPDYFFGAGFRLIDNDIKSLIGAASLTKQ